MQVQHEIYNVYCDESRHDDQKSAFMVIGGIWCPREHKEHWVGRLKNQRVNGRTWGEWKWKNVSPSRLSFYKQLVSDFVSDDLLRFRAIVVNRDELDYQKFHEGDEELGFYKFYYLLLEKWVEAGNEYYVLLDYKQNRDRKRVPVLKAVLQNAVKSQNSVIRAVEVLDSKEVLPLQIVDILIGAIGYQYNGIQTSAAKLELCAHIANLLHLPHLRISTQRDAMKFNVFRFRPRR
jgi:hypothetical protein